MAIGLSSSRKLRTAIPRGTLAICAAILCCLAGAAPAADETVRLRLAWGGGTPTKWVGKISLSEGSLSQLQLTGTETDAPGSMWIDGGAVHVAAPRPRRVDGCDLTATAPLTAMLRVELAGDPATPPRAVEIPLEKLWRQYERLPIDDRGNAVLVHRATADWLRVITDREHLIFAPDELFGFDLALMVPGIEPGSSLELNVELLSGRGPQSTWDEQHRISVPVDQHPRIPLTVPLPRAEGVYTIRITAAKPAGFHERWVPGVAAKMVAQRQFQVVVFDPERPAAPSVESWRTLLEIDPAHPAWVWLPAARFMPKGPLGSAPAHVVDHPLGRFVELNAHAATESANWQAYPLPITQPGLPHLIEVEYPADAPQELGISLVEPNAAGRVAPPGQDSGSLVDEWSAQTEAGVRRVQYVCWPRTASPMLVIRNPSTKQVARFGKIRVLAAGNELPLVAAPAGGDWPKRLVAAYIARPYLAESLGATDAAAASGQTVHDWQSYYEASTRLADYLRYAGYNAAVINVAAEGSAIYPSRILQRTPRFDRSWLDSGTTDLPAIDPLELLLRVCDRARVAVVPALRMDSPLPQLESQRRSDPLLDAALVCRDVRGKDWHQWFAASKPAAVRYNLLHPSVQQSFGDVAQEVVDRYGNHPSFAGLGIQLAGGTSATLPSPRWTSDAITLQAYLEETNAVWPTAYDAADPVARGRGLAEQDAPFRAWRANRVSRFYSEIAARLSTGNSSRRLVLLSEELFDDPEFTARIRPRLNGAVAWTELLREAGIAPQHFANDPHTHLLRPTYVSDGRALADAAHDEQVNAADELDKLVAQGTFGGLLQYQRPAAERLTSFEAVSPFGAERTNLTIGTSPLPDASVGQRQIVSSLAETQVGMVVVGGMTLPRGGEDLQRPLLQLLAALPEQLAPGDSPSATKHGVSVRMHADATGTVCVLVNQAPWIVETAVTLNFPQGGRMAPLPNEPKLPAGEFYSPGQHVWNVTLQPFDAVAMRCDVPQVTVAGLRTRVAPSAASRLTAQLQDLRSRDLNDQRTYPVLINPSLEPTETATIAGWSVFSTAADGTATLDTTAPHAGKTSLRLQAGGGNVGIAGTPFANPGTGQLALTTYIRVRGVEPTTELRIIFQSERHGYRQYTSVNGQQLTSTTGEFAWRNLVFGVDDLPLDSRGQIQVRFELSGPGEVWIDDVGLHDLLFPHDNFYAEASQQKLALVRKISAADAALSEDRLFDCWKNVDDYWLKFVNHNLPLLEATAEIAGSESQPPPASATKPPKPPSMSERVKQYVPGFLR
ncbi:MAG: hypothetical protein WD851_08605 [Pirellulales bacterium]